MTAGTTKNGFPLRLMDLRQGEKFRFADEDEVCVVEDVTPIGEWFVKDSRGNQMCYSGWWHVEKVSE